MSCPICLEAVKTSTEGPGTELCCGGHLYHLKCLMSIAKWDDSVIRCPVCRADVPFPVVYGNVLDKRPGIVVHPPFTRYLLSKSTNREARNDSISLCDYVMVTLDDDDCLDILLDIKSAIAMQKPVCLRGSVPGGLAKKANLPIPPPATRKRKLEIALKDDLLCQAAKYILATRVQKSQYYLTGGLVLYYA